MNPRSVWPIDRLVAAYNLILAVVWGLLLSRVTYAPWVLAAHAIAVFLPSLLKRAPGRPSRFTRNLREFYPLLWLLAFWSELDFLRALLHQVANDGPIAALDRAILGVHLNAVWMTTMPEVWLSEVMHFLYFAYYPLIFVPPLVMALSGRRTAFRDMALRLLVTYLACFLVYIAFPVDGPHYLMTQYEGALTDGFFYKLVRALQGFGDSRGAAFPSSHVAGAVTIAFLGWRWFGPGIASLLTVEAAGVVLSTVYTQNHYAIDALAGLAWALTLQLLVVPALSRWLGPGPPRRLVPVLPAFVPVPRATRAAT